MSDIQMAMKFENLPNEILIDCFEYFHSLELRFSFGQLNHRFEQIIQCLPLHLDFQHVHKSMYDLLCQQILSNPDAKKRVYSLRLSNENTPEQINDFLSKFSLDEFSQLHSLTFIDLRDHNIPQLQSILPKLSQITTCHLLDSKINQTELQLFLPIDHLLTLSINANLILIEKTIPMKRLILSGLSLNEICRLFSYTPFLQYLSLSQVTDGRLDAEYHQSVRPARLQEMILTHFRPKFNDLTHLLKKCSNLQSLTISASKDHDMIDASRWERFIKYSLPSLINLRFKFIIDDRWNPRNVTKSFNRFQTNFWLQEHQWFTECAANKQSMMIYTIPYIPEWKQIPLASRRYTNPMNDNVQTFKDVKKLTLSASDLFEHGDYHFPNIESLVFIQSPKMSTENDEERVMESLIKIMSFSHLKHLEIPFNCQTQRSSLLFQILDLSPQLSSLCTDACFFEPLLHQPESKRYLDGRIRKLNLNHYDSHQCRRFPNSHSLYQLVPNLERLTMPINRSEDWLFLLNHFSKLSSFQVTITSANYPEFFDHFKSEAAERNAIFQEIVKKHWKEVTVTFSVWIGRK